MIPPQSEPVAKKAKARVIAHYLPQFHPIPENDLWWGKGFSEWTNTARAKPLFRGHYQPNVPADLGFYDLRVPETRAAQAEMARAHGVEAFCYWHYWFAGDRLLERPFNEVLRSGEPDFPFCLGWANHTWSGVWYGEPKRILKEQTYPGMQDHEAHFYTLLEAFKDPRYLTVDGKPFFLVFQPRELPDAKRVTDFWRELADKEGLKGLHLVGLAGPEWVPEDFGFDAVTISTFNYLMESRVKDVRVKIRRRVRSHPLSAPLLNKFLPQPFHIYSYQEALQHFVVENAQASTYYPCVLPNWDNTPRSGVRGLVLRNSTPELFRIALRKAKEKLKNMPSENQIIIMKSWNEWAEGNYLEPDLRNGLKYLEVLKEEILG